MTELQIQGYQKYLVDNGWAPEKAQGYADYLRTQHLTPEQEKLAGAAEAFGAGENFLKKGVERVGQIADIPGQIVRTGIASAMSLPQTVRGEKGLVSEQDAKNALVGKGPSTEDLLSRGGMKPGLLRSAMGFAGDILSDPVFGPMGESTLKYGSKIPMIGKYAEKLMPFAKEPGLASRAVEKVGQVAADIAPKLSPNAEQIMQAGERVGSEPTLGMLYDSPTIRGLESTLEQSPTIPGAFVRKNVEKAQRPIQEAITKNLEGASNLSPYEAGTEMKKGLISNIAERHQPTQMIYDFAGQYTKDMPLGDLGKSRVARNIKNIESAAIIPGSPESKIADQFSQGINNSTTVKQLQLLETRAKEILRDPTYSGVEKSVAAEALDKIVRFKNNSILRSAVQAARTPGEGMEIGREIIDEIKSAHKEYKAHMQDLGLLGQNTNLTSGKYGVSNVLREIDQARAEDVPRQLFQSNNYDFLKFLKEKYPEQYDLAKQQKLAEVLKSSTDPQGHISANKFRSVVDKMGPEIKSELFGVDNNVDDILDLIESRPPRMGPSGTPQGHAMQMSWNPMQQFKDLGVYGVYRGLPKAERAASGLIKLGKTKIPDYMARRGLINIAKPSGENE